MARKQPAKRNGSSVELPINDFDPEQATIYRIAGHAIVLAKGGAEFSTISIEPTDERLLGRIEAVRASGHRVGALYGMLAGPIAERMYTKQWNLEPDDEGVMRFARVLAEIPPGDPARGLGRAWEALCTTEETAEILWYSWPSVEALARELTERRRVTFAEVDAILKRDPAGSRRPLVPTAEEILSELDIVLRQNHNVELGDWRSCPRSAPVPAQSAKVEPRTPGMSGVPARRKPARKP
ncbi:MAG: hypothetical protein JO257_21345 [Deltaproteobacteria bacterium]|nr:hypothetical protein [Deltaproteobacteria bacterium]